MSSFILLFVCVAIKSQTIIGYVKYRTISNTDTTQLQKDSVGFMNILYFNTDSSVYVREGKKKDGNNLKILKPEKDQAELQNGNKTSISGIIIDDEVGPVIFKANSTNKVTQRNLILINKAAYIHDELIPKIKWSLIDSIRNIGGFKCQGAVAGFRGRNYTAWFASDLPVNAGPWKLSGLPGLILEAYDEKREIQWLFSGIRIPSDVAFTIAKPTKGKMISFNAYKSIDKDEFERTKKIVLATMPQNRGDLSTFTLHTYPIEKSYKDE